MAATVAIRLLRQAARDHHLLLPALFARRGFDPALGSGRIATVVQDVLSLLIHFLVASLRLFRRMTPRWE
jgi:magnesium transporter